MTILHNLEMRFKSRMSDGQANLHFVFHTNTNVRMTQNSIRFEIETAWMSPAAYNGLPNLSWLLLLFADSIIIALKRQ